MSKHQLQLRGMIAKYCQDLETAQTQLKDVLTRKQIALATPTPQEIQQLTLEESEVLTVLNQLVERRSELLAVAASLGLPANTIREVSRAIEGIGKEMLEQVDRLSYQATALQRLSQSQWVACQKSVLHYGHLIQFLANGGRKYVDPRNGKAPARGGAILDASV